MKKVLCLTIVLTLISISLAFATVVDSRENEDLTEIEIVEIVPRFTPTPVAPPEPTPMPPEKVIEIVPVNPEDEPPEPPVVQIVEPPEEIELLIEELKPTYELTIIYLYSDGTPASETVRETLEAGQPVDTPIPGIPGYTPTGGYWGPMPPRNLQVTVIYTPAGAGEELIDIGDYETPLGLGASMMNVGVCVE